MEVGLEKRLLPAIRNVIVTPTTQTWVRISYRGNLSLDELDFAV